nr:hypothetical protein [Tanacetum cinerariifolium]
MYWVDGLIHLSCRGNGVATTIITDPTCQQVNKEKTFSRLIKILRYSVKGYIKTRVLRSGVFCVSGDDESLRRKGSTWLKGQSKFSSSESHAAQQFPQPSLRRRHGTDPPLKGRQLKAK